MIHSTDKNIDSKVDHKPAFYLAKTGATRYYLSVPKLLALQFVYMLWMLKLKKKMLLLVFTLLSYLIFLVYMYFTSMLNKVVVYKILESRSMLHLTGRPGHPSNRSYSLQIFFLSLFNNKRANMFLFSLLRFIFFYYVQRTLIFTLSLAAILRNWTQGKRWIGKESASIFKYLMEMIWKMNTVWGRGNYESYTWMKERNGERER